MSLVLKRVNSADETYRDLCPCGLFLSPHATCMLMRLRLRGRGSAQGRFREEGVLAGVLIVVGVDHVATKHHLHLVLDALADTGVDMDTIEVPRLFRVENGQEERIHQPPMRNMTPVDDPALQEPGPDGALQTPAELLRGSMAPAAALGGLTPAPAGSAAAAEPAAEEVQEVEQEVRSSPDWSPDPLPSSDDEMPEVVQAAVAGGSSAAAGPRSPPRPSQAAPIGSLTPKALPKAWRATAWPLVKPAPLVPVSAAAGPQSLPKPPVAPCLRPAAVRSKTARAKPPPTVTARPPLMKARPKLMPIGGLTPSALCGTTDPLPRVRVCSAGWCNLSKVHPFDRELRLLEARVQYTAIC